MLALPTGMLMKAVPVTVWFGRMMDLSVQLQVKIGQVWMVPDGLLLTALMLQLK